MDRTYHFKLPPESVLRLAAALGPEELCSAVDGWDFYPETSESYQCLCFTKNSPKTLPDLLESLGITGEFYWHPYLATIDPEHKYDAILVRKHKLHKRL